MRAKIAHSNCLGASSCSQCLCIHEQLLEQCPGCAGLLAGCSVKAQDPTGKVRRLSATTECSPAPGEGGVEGCAFSYFITSFFDQGGAVSLLTCTDPACFGLLCKHKTISKLI